MRTPQAGPGPTGPDRLEEIGENLIARIAEAEREGWLGEEEGLRVSLAEAEDELAQIDTAVQQHTHTTNLGMPTLRQTHRTVESRTGTVKG
ncbi:hypothetical protein OG782_36830 [Streptomyces sp. NBC_00876]|uniref:hypothetical protein n=1 Tax=Streptomyces sp. NBC_00876 TaxID=2975853 RepID=UPI0038660D2C|nr:hypothetical protein OG782_36830 [Streptomyces sp. NBC_00876]